MKRFWPLHLVTAGLCLLVGGFVYGAMFAGIPYQDPTPEMSASYARHLRIAAITCGIGGAAFLLGCIAGIIRLVVRRFRRPAVS